MLGKWQIKFFNVKRKHGYEMKIVELYMGIYFYEDIGYGIVLRKKLKIVYGI